MHANNEIGTIHPIDKICQIAKNTGISVHSDAVQSVGKIPVNVEEIGLDLLSISAHKFNSPKALVVCMYGVVKGLIIYFTAVNTNEIVEQEPKM